MNREVREEGFEDIDLDNDNDDDYVPRRRYSYSREQKLSAIEYFQPLTSSSKMEQMNEFPIDRSLASSLLLVLLSADGLKTTARSSSKGKEPSALANHGVK